MGETETAVLVSAKWLVAQADAGAVLPRRQELPPAAILTAAALRAHHETLAMSHVRAPVIAVSYCWLTESHPDPEGEQLQLLAKAFRERFAAKSRQHEWVKHGFGESEVMVYEQDFGVFLDWCSLYQEPRSPSELRSFKLSLQFINLWYAHELTQVYMLTKLPLGYEESSVVPYGERGWPTFERAISGILKVRMGHVFPALVDLGEGARTALSSHQHCPSSLQINCGRSTSRMARM